MAWTQSGNIKGASGAPGASGASGAVGATGATGASGASGQPGTTTWSGITDKPAVIARSIFTITTPTTLGSTANTDYVYFLGGESTTQTLLLHMNGANNSTSFSDSSGNGYTVTANGDAKVSTTQSKFGGASAYFDGTGDYLSVTNSGQFDFGTGDFTVDFWLYPSSLSGEITFLAASGSGGMLIGYIGGVAVGRVGVAYDYTVGALSTNTWAHIAVTRSGTNLRVFINGTQSGTTQTNSTSYNFTTAFQVGRFGTTTANYNGYIDELRVLKGTAAWTSNFTAPTAAYADAAIGTPTLPTAASNTNLYTLKNISSSSITPATTSSQTIDGTTPSALAAGSTVRLISDGSNWRTV